MTLNYVEIYAVFENPSPAYRQAGPLSRVLPLKKRGEYFLFDNQ